MSSVYNYLVGSLPFRKSSTSNNNNGAETEVNGKSAESESNHPNGKEATESTSLLNSNKHDNETPHSAETSSSTFGATSTSDQKNPKSTVHGELQPLNDNDDGANTTNGVTVPTQQQHDDKIMVDTDHNKNDVPLLQQQQQQQRPPTVNEYYFSPNNPTVQRYYRFTSTPLTPIAALHKRPSTGPTTPGSDPAAGGGGVTGLLRRSAVVPSHGTDATGQWILVSVGGRSGWARKKSPQHHYAGFTPAETFAATEGWMGNHAFLCQGMVVCYCICLLAIPLCQFIKKVRQQSSFFVWRMYDSSHYLKICLLFM